MDRSRNNSLATSERCQNPKCKAMGRSPFPEDDGDVDNTWNAYARDINETVVLEDAKFTNESGLLEAGYEYSLLMLFPGLNVVDGDCWMDKNRSEDGYFILDFKRFPCELRLLLTKSMFWA
jgi:hypothetical protein